MWPAVGSIVGAMQNVETMTEPIQTQDIQRPPQSLIDSLKEIGSATASGELKRSRASDTRSCPRYQSRLAVKLHHRFFSLSRRRRDAFDSMPCRSRGTRNCKTR